MKRPRLIDFNCCAGGAGMGYHLAGFDVVGVDIKPQPRYPFEAIQADVRDIDPRWVAENFDAAHASPPCQFGTALRHAKGTRKDHLNLIPETRALLKASGLPYIIENVGDVARAGHLVDPIMLNGFMFDLGCTTSTGVRFHLERERWFETSFGATAPTGWTRKTPICGHYGAHLRNRSAAHGGRGTVDFPGEDRPALSREAMQMPWATMAQMSEAIPPAFTQFLGQQLLAHLQQRVAA